ncbi:RNA binding (RRM/RBD/RNP motifs) family protein [Actinidia rufa]|uniref:RNA binding (RRM/RBD/RNP motifs) family protein n=1 Tax=Actinidia rufa TaxID=165716 RepID=A0A7J0H4C7_9ERIC|nr:RNA binding (RRM/RBD/RNP motifs) family protein [Actinidia rufa]
MILTRLSFFEQLLHHREYFGQYGKVLKVSISRTAAGTIQQFPNNTCSVYIMYTKDEEAVRCIQSVHGFVLDGRSLRWAQVSGLIEDRDFVVQPCSNPHCLYLHEFGSQEDSFTKDEILSAYTRILQPVSAVLHQIVAPANRLLFQQRPSGTTQVPVVHIEFGKKLIPNEEGRSVLHKAKQEPRESGRRDIRTDRQSTSSEAPATPGLAATLTVNRKLQLPPTFEDNDRCISLAPNITNSFNLSGRSNGPGLDKDLNISVNGNIQNLCSDMASINIDRHIGAEHSGNAKSNGSPSDNIMVKSPQNKGLQQCYPEHFREPSTSIALGEAVASAADIEMRKRQVAFPEVEEDLRHFEDQRLKDPEVVADASYFPDHSHSYQLSCHSRVHSPQRNAACGSTSYNREPKILDYKVDNDLLLHSSGVPKIPNGYSENIITRLIDSDKTTKHSYLLPTDVKKTHIGRIEAEAANVDQNVAKGLGESSIISNILSMDFDAWDDSLTSPQSLAKFQSRFSFARQEDSKNQVSDIEPSLSNIEKVCKDCPLSLEFAENRDCNFDKLGDYNGSSTFTIEESNCFAGSYSHLSSNKLSVSKVQELTLLNIGLSPVFNQWYGGGPREGRGDRGNEMLGKRFLAISDEARGVNLSRWWLFPTVRRFETMHWLFGWCLEDWCGGLKQSNHHAYIKLPLPTGRGLLRYVIFLLKRITDLIPLQCLVIVSRTQVSAPPGFSLPSRVPPPGFVSHEKMEPTFDAISLNSSLDASSSTRNLYQAPPTENVGTTGDIEFMDPAILAVGKGILPVGPNNAASLDMRSNFSSQLSAFENEARLQLLMQRSLSPLQNHRLANLGDGIAPFSDAYRIPSRITEQTMTSYAPPSRQSRTSLIMSNGQWDSWNKVQSGNGLGMVEILRTERLGFNKLYSGYDDSKYRMPSLGDLYNRTYGI